MFIRTGIFVHCEEQNFRPHLPLIYADFHEGLLIVTFSFYLGVGSRHQCCRGSFKTVEKEEGPMPDSISCVKTPIN